MRVERCDLCQTELTLSNTDGQRHVLRNYAQVLYSQRNEARDNLAKFMLAYDWVRLRFDDEYQGRFAECDESVKQWKNEKKER